MDDSTPMGISNGPGDDFDQGRRFRRWAGTAAPSPPSGSPFDELKGDERSAGHFADLVDLHDIQVLKPRDGLRLGPKAMEIPSSPVPGRIIFNATSRPRLRSLALNASPLAPRPTSARSSRMAETARILCREQSTQNRGRVRLGCDRGEPLFQSLLHQRVDLEQFTKVLLPARETSEPLIRVKDRSELVARYIFRIDQFEPPCRHPSRAAGRWRSNPRHRLPPLRKRDSSSAQARPNRVCKSVSGRLVAMDDRPFSRGAGPGDHHTSGSFVSEPSRTWRLGNARRNSFLGAARVPYNNGSEAMPPPNPCEAIEPIVAELRPRCLNHPKRLRTSSAGWVKGMRTLWRSCSGSTNPRSG